MEHFGLYLKQIKSDHFGVGPTCATHEKNARPPVATGGGGLSVTITSRNQNASPPRQCNTGKLCADKNFVSVRDS